MIISLFILVIIFLSLLSLIIGAKDFAIFFPTHKNYIKEALKLADLKPSEKFYDLGCGDGRVLICAAKDFGTKSIGFEISPIIFLIAKVNILIKGLNKKAEVHFKNFYKADLTQADVVFIFGMKHSMPKLIKKLKSEVKKGTKIISYVFQIPGWKPEKSYKVNGKELVYLYKL